MIYTRYLQPKEFAEAFINAIVSHYLPDDIEFKVKNFQDLGVALSYIGSVDEYDEACDNTYVRFYLLTEVQAQASRDQSPVLELFDNFNADCIRADRVFKVYIGESGSTAIFGKIHTKEDFQ